MTTYTLSTSRALRPARMTWRDGLNLRVSRSPLTGWTESTALAGGLWRMTTEHPDQAMQERGALEGLHGLLLQGGHRLSAFDQARPVPLGDIRTSGVTLGASASLWASSLTLAGCLGTNRLRYPDHLDNGWWTKSGAFITAGAAAGWAPGRLADKLVEDSSTGFHYLNRGGIAVVTGQAVTLSAYIKSAGRSALRMQVTDAGASGNYVQQVFDAVSGSITFSAVAGAASLVSAAMHNVGDGWWRCSMRVLASATATAVSLNLHLMPATSGSASYAGTGSSGVLFDGLQLNDGELQPYMPYATLLAGDRIGVGGQLFKVLETATADAAGAMSVQVMHRVRAALSSGAAVTLDRPRVLFVPDPESPVDWSAALGGRCPPVAVDWVEVPA